MQELIQLVEQIRQLEICKTELGRIEEQILLVDDRILELENQIGKKISSLELLEENGLIYLFHLLRGSYEISLAEAKEDYLVTVMNVNEATKTRDFLDSERNKIVELLQNYDFVIHEFKSRLLRKKEESFHGQLKEYRIVIEKLEFKAGLRKELQEAIQVGSELTNAVEKVRYFLKKQTDYFDKEKHYRIESILNARVLNLHEYQEQIVNIKHLLLKFESELKDVLKQDEEKNQWKYTIGLSVINEYAQKLLLDFRTNSSLLESFELFKRIHTKLKGILSTLKPDYQKLDIECEELIVLERELISTL